MAQRRDHSTTFDRLFIGGMAIVMAVLVVLLALAVFGPDWMVALAALG
jgi:hypothetical protein